MTDTAASDAPKQSPPVPGFWELVREDLQTNRRGWTYPGFRALFVYRLGAYRRSVRRPLLRLLLTVVYLIGNRIVQHRYHMTIPPTAQIGRRLRFPHARGIVFHRYAKVGDDCRVLHGVTIGAIRQVNPDTAPELGDRVSVGTGAVILGHVRIGSDVKVGPNAVVMSDVPDHSTVFAPAPRIISTPSSGWADGERRD